MKACNRILIFIFICVSVRLFFVYGSYKILHLDNKLHQRNKLLRYLIAVLGFYIGISFVNQYIKKKPIGGFGGKAYWHPFRIIHGINYIVFGLLCAVNFKKAYLVLLFDVILGILVFINNYFLKIY